MNILTLDFETYFSNDYTLRKLTTEAYIRDPQFEVLLVGVMDSKGNKTWWEKEKIAFWFDKIDWTQTAILCHHAHFDGLILSHHFGIRPVFWFDTLSMGRLVHGNTLSVALASLSKHYGFEDKSVPYDLFKGRRWVDLDSHIRDELGRGCIHDVDLTWRLFGRLSESFPQEEYRVIDTTIRMFTEPTLVGDIALYEQVRDDEWSRKNEALLELGVGKGQLQSPAQFIKLLEAEGVEIEYKAGTNGPIPAIAATDEFMKGLVDDADPRVAGLASARLEVRSTIDETRAGRLATMARRGPLAVYLGYCGAHTTRWSGGDRINFQNLPRSGELRRGIRAPEGYKLAIIDLSQIEDRMLCMCAGQWDAAEDYRQGKDPYTGLASEFYGFVVDKKLHPTERGTGKQMKLSCGYGSGAATFQRTAARGSYGPPVKISLERAQEAVRIYRTKNARIVNYWHQGDNMLAHMAQGSGEVQWGPVTVLGADCGSRIILPNGIPMIYRLEWDEEARGWRRKTRQGWARIWGGVVAQNMMEGLCRLVLSQAMIRIRAAGHRIVMCSHDEVVVLVPEDMTAGQFLLLQAMMTEPPAWMPDIPLECEGMLAERYEK